MRISLATLILTALCASPAGFPAELAAQSPSGATPPAAAPQAQSSAPDAKPQSPAAAPATLAPGAVPTPTHLLKPSLDSLQQAIGNLQLDKWKKGSVRDEAAANITSIQKDLQWTLPALLATADQTPGAVSQSLPVARNISALYDVLLRVVDGMRMVAPADQFGQMQQAMAGLEKGRHALDDQMQDRATSQEKQFGDLQVAFKNRPAPVCPVVPPPPPPAPAKKVVPKKRKPAAAKPADKPGTATPSSSQPAPAAKPQQ